LSASVRRSPISSVPRFSLPFTRFLWRLQAVGGRIRQSELMTAIDKSANTQKYLLSLCWVSTLPGTTHDAPDSSVILLHEVSYHTDLLTKLFTFHGMIVVCMAAVGITFQPYTHRIPTEKSLGIHTESPYPQNRLVGAPLTSLK